LPWELVWDEAGALLFSHGKMASCVRYLDLEQMLSPLSASGRALRILVIAPHASVPTAVHEEERESRRRTFANLEQAGSVVLEELKPASLKALVDRLQSGPPVDILHFYGHTRYRDRQGALLFDTHDDNERWVSVDRIAALLGDVRLVLLQQNMASLDGAMLPAVVATGLSVAGARAVVTLQLPLRSRLAARFAAVVYRELARGTSVQRAVSLGRQALYVEAEDAGNWYIPTLTIRSRYAEPFRLVQGS
jgi:hypothetical protein